MIMSQLAPPASSSGPQRQNSYKLFKKKPMILQSKEINMDHSVLLIITARLGKKIVSSANYDMLL